jgi:hypothetical protein
MGHIVIGTPSNVPNDHFRQTMLASIPLGPSLSKQTTKDRDSDPKGRMRTWDQTPHFKAVKHMFELVGDGIPKKASSIPRKLLKYAGRGTNIALFKLPGNDGKSSYLCLSPSCQPPWNKCCAIPCENTKSRSSNRL